jgi:hypothetical protein
MLFGVRNRLSGWTTRELSVLLWKDRGSKPKAIDQLERKHDFMLGKEEIAGLEIVKPSIIFNGYLLIKRKTGKPIKIRFRGQ